MDWFLLIDRSSLVLSASPVISTFQNHGQHCLHFSDVFLLSAGDHSSNVHHKFCCETFRYIYGSYTSLICPSFTPIPNFPQERCSFATILFMLVTQYKNQLILCFMGRLQYVANKLCTRHSFLSFAAYIFSPHLKFAISKQCNKQQIIR